MARTSLSQSIFSVVAPTAAELCLGSKNWGCAPAAHNNTNRTWTLAVFSVCVSASVATGFHIFVSFYKSWYSPDSCCSSPTGQRRRWCSVPTADREWGSSGRASWSAPLPALPVSHTHTHRGRQGLMCQIENGKSCVRLCDHGHFAVLTFGLQVNLSSPATKLQLSPKCT